MQTRLSLIVVAMISLVFGAQASASPITFAFTGYLPDPLDGAQQLSGTFTIDGDPPGGGINGVMENGTDVSITLNVGSQQFTFGNQQPTAGYATFTVGTSPTWLLYQTGPRQDEFAIYGATHSSSSNVSFGMTFYNPSAIDDFSNLRTMSFNLASGSAYVTHNFGFADTYAGGGSVTSIELVPTPTPEPGTLAIFAVLAAAAMTRVRRS